MNEHKMQALIFLCARSALKCNIISTDKCFTTAVFNGKESLLPSLTTTLSSQSLRYCLCPSYFSACLL